MKVVEDIAEMKNISRGAHNLSLTVVLVPTMGYLHQAHMELIEKAKTLGDFLVLSIFVNPAQFGPEEDFTSYPRGMERDLKMAEAAGVSVIFTPPTEQMYPEAYQTYVEVEELGRPLCGLSRPEHFRGVATVVTKLFNIVKPHRAVFGLKDYQQLVVIKRLIEDLNMDVEIVPVETVREADEVAISSRNSYLDNREREAARVIPSSIDAARKAFKEGERRSEKVIETVKKIIENEPAAMIDYVKVCDPETLADVDRIDKKALLAIAVKIGRARLIDNCMLS
jgi:pantoate--beta-alanine ligase